MKLKDKVLKHKERYSPPYSSTRFHLCLLFYTEYVEILGLASVSVCLLKMQAISTFLIACWE